MINRVEGLVVEKSSDSLVLMVGGIGLKIFATQSCLSDCDEGRSISLRTYLLVKEDALALYGFASADECDIFNLLIGVSGVGPKLAMSILSNGSTELVRQAVVQDQPELLSRLPGLGKKTAQKIVLDLQGKFSGGFATEGLQAIHTSDLEVIEALTALGYSIVQAQTAVQSLPNDTLDDVETKLRLALQSLG